MNDIACILPEYVFLFSHGVDRRLMKLTERATRVQEMVLHWINKSYRRIRGHNRRFMIFESAVDAPINLQSNLLELVKLFLCAALFSNIRFDEPCKPRWWWSSKFSENGQCSCLVRIHHWKGESLYMAWVRNQVYVFAYKGNTSAVC